MPVEDDDGGTDPQRRRPGPGVCRVALRAEYLTDEEGEMMMSADISHLPDEPVTRRPSEDCALP